MAAALGGLIVLLLLVSRGSGKGSRGPPNGLKEPATAAEPEVLSGPSDPHDIVLTVITSVKSAHTSVTTTLFLDSIFVSLASYRCVIWLVCLLLHHQGGADRQSAAAGTQSATRQYQTSLPQRTFRSACLWALWSRTRSRMKAA